MCAFESGKGGKVLIDQYSLTSYLNSMDINRAAEAPETTTYGNNDRTYLPGGLRGGTVSLGGFWDGTSGAVDDVIQAALGSATAKVITLGPGGLANSTSYVSDVAYLLSAFHTTYTISAPVDGIVALTVDVQSTGGLESGYSLADLAARTTTSAGNPIDEGGATTNGGIGHLHVTAASGTSPTLDVLIEDSTDDQATDPAWAEVIAFAQVSAVTKERKAATGAVDQYVRVSWTIDDETGGSPSFTFTVSWARR